MHWFPPTSRDQVLEKTVIDYDSLLSIILILK